MKSKASKSDIESTGKLLTRMSANAAAARDFDEWCFRQLPELPLKADILDLGCGTGKQLLLFSPVFTPATTFWGLDTAAESLERLKRSYDHPPNLRLIEADFDWLDRQEELTEGHFDLIYGSYALYYTKNLEELIRQCYRLLKPGGVFWNISPYRGTNIEFLSILRKYHEVEPFMDYVFDRFYQEMAEIAQEVGFQSCKPALLRNKVPFPTAESFMKYLQNSLFYHPGHDQAIEKEVAAVVQENGIFEVTKNVISLQFRK